MAELKFWNGNKSAQRQLYELTILRRVLEASYSPYANATLIDDKTDYPDAGDEGNIFHRDIDLCVTVAGNPKFRPGDYIPVMLPLMNGLLGHRLMIIRQTDADDFAGITNISQLKNKKHGIPATWADAELFRSNGYQVNERGTVDELFQRLQNKECDYVALGVNEVNSIFEQYANKVGGLMIEPSLRFYYPYALVFYVHPNNQHLALSIEKGLYAIKQNGIFQSLFQSFYGETLAKSLLNERRPIHLQNRDLPNELISEMKVCHDELLTPTL